VARSALEHPETRRTRPPLGRARPARFAFHDPATGRDITWQTHRTPAGLAFFAGIGLLAGMFGLGAAGPTYRC
jgi:hypothetical protein